MKVEDEPIRTFTSAARLAFVLWLIVCALAAGGSAEDAPQQEQAESTVPSESAVGGGRWESARDDAGKRDLEVQIQRFEDGSILGSVIVVGSSYMHKARLEGRVDGKEVYGVLVGDGDHQIGTFSGFVTGKGLSGTYTTNQGDTGTWSWTGQAPVQALKTDADGT